MCQYCENNLSQRSFLKHFMVFLFDLMCIKYKHLIITFMSIKINVKS